jgi:hypothetical protein
MKLYIYGNVRFGTLDLDFTFNSNEGIGFNTKGTIAIYHMAYLKESKFL